MNNRWAVTHIREWPLIVLLIFMSTTQLTSLAAADTAEFQFDPVKIEIERFAQDLDLIVAPSHYAALHFSVQDAVMSLPVDRRPHVAMMSFWQQVLRILRIGLLIIQWTVSNNNTWQEKYLNQRH